MRARRLAAWTLGLLLAAGPALAFLDPTGPAVTAALSTISDILDTLIHVEVVLQDAKHLRIFNIFRSVAFTDDAVLTPITRSIMAVKSIRREVQDLSCNWQFSPRTRALRDLMLKPVRFCKPQVELVWDSGEGFWDEWLEEHSNKMAALTMNLHSDRAEAEYFSWDRIFPGMFGASGTVRKSMAEAERDAAVSMSAANMIEKSNLAFETQRLNLASWEAATDRYFERLDREAALSLYANFSEFGAQPRGRAGAAGAR